MTTSRALPILFAFSFLTTLLGGCANAPKFSQMTLPPIPQGQGRIIAFRDGFPLGIAIQPSVTVDEKPVGTSVPNNFFFVDVAPGQHKVSCQTEWRHDTIVTVPENQILYVQTHIAPGVIVGQVWPEAVDPNRALSILKDCTYNGPPLPQPSH